MTFLPVSDAPERGPEAHCERCGSWAGLTWREGRFVCADRRVCVVARRERRADGRGTLFVVCSCGKFGGVCAKHAAEAVAARRERFSAEWNWWPINRPRIMLCDPYEGEIWVGIHHGNGNSDPVWRVDVLLTGLVARPFIAWANWRWDRSVARQNAKRRQDERRKVGR